MAAEGLGFRSSEPGRLGAHGFVRVGDRRDPGALQKRDVPDMLLAHHARTDDPIAQRQHVQTSTASLSGDFHDRNTERLGDGVKLGPVIPIDQGGVMLDRGAHDPCHDRAGGSVEGDHTRGPGKGFGPP